MPFIDIGVSVSKFEFSGEEQQGEFHLAARVTNNRTVGSEKFKQVKQTNSRDKTKGFEKVDVKLDFQSNVMEPDDRLIIEMMTSTKNSEGGLSPTRAGQSAVYMSDIQKAAKAGKNVLMVDCYMPQLIMGGQPYSKGSLLIELKNFKDAANWKFNKVNKYHVLDQNMKGVESALERCIDWQKMVVETKSNPEVKTIAMPLMVDVECIPGKMFFTNFSNGESDEEREKFYMNLRDIALAREGKTSEWFNSELSKMKQTKTVSKDALSVYSVLSRIVTLPSVSTYYKADQAYARGPMKSIEEFSLADRFAKIGHPGADCEDTGNLAYYHFRQIQSTNFKGEDMKLLSWFSKNYVPFGVITSVQGKELADSNGQKIKVYIGDSNDRKVQFGAHIFCLSIPYGRFIKMVNKSDVSKFKSNDLNADDVKFSEKLDCLVHEGTGDLHPIVFPFECVHSDKEQRRKDREYHVGMHKAAKTLTKYEAIAAGSLHRLPSSTTDEPGARFDFYRIPSGLYTDVFNEHTGDEFLIFDQSGKRGVELRYLIYSNNKTGNPRNEPNFQVPLLVPSPRESEEDKKYFLSLKRQLPFKSDFDRISSETVKTIGNGVSGSGAQRLPSLVSFVEACQKIVGSRNYRGLKTSDVVVSYKSDDFFDLKYKGTTPLANKMLQEIQSESRIVDVHAELAQISDSMSVVDIHFKVSDSQPVQSTSSKCDFSIECKVNPMFPLVRKSL